MNIDIPKLLDTLFDMMNNLDTFDNYDQKLAKQLYQKAKKQLPVSIKEQALRLPDQYRVQWEQALYKAIKQDYTVKNVALRFVKPISNQKPPTLSRQQYQETINTLVEYMQKFDTRKSLIQTALFGSQVLYLIDWNGASRPFTEKLVNILVTYNIDDLVELLEYMIKEYPLGMDKKQMLKHQLESIKREIAS